MNIVIIGAGINGLVAANYLKRSGHAVTILERKPTCGGCCAKAATRIKGKTYEYPPGASVFGLMQDFIFEELGLTKKVQVFVPNKWDVVKFPGHEPYPVNEYHQWGEKGDVEGFKADMSVICHNLRHFFKIGKVPFDLETAVGTKLYERWVTGSAKDLFHHYFTSELTGMLHSIPVTESGPVSLDEPYSAFNIPLMNCGRPWGFVKDGIWSIIDHLVKMNEHLGVKIICNAEVLQIDSKKVFTNKGVVIADVVVFATDPVTASKLAGVDIGVKRFVGDSAKEILFFDKPISFDAFHFIFEDGKYFEIYPEGPCRRRLGWSGAEYVSVFYKEGSKVNVKELTERYTGKSVGSVTLTSRDLKDLFYLPDGNIDHMEICAGQTLWSRTFSKTKNFYQLGDKENYFYCGAGGFPCGSVTGTVGYLCAKQIIAVSSNG